MSAESLLRKSWIAIFLISFSFYLYTLAPVVTFVDSGELAAVIATRGVPHPTGFPFYLLLASFAAIIPIGSFIWRLNAFSALWGGVSVAVTYLIFFRICKSPHQEVPRAVKKAKKERVQNKTKVPIISDLERPWVGAFAAAFAWMTNRALWNTATVTEVYALHAFLITLFCFFLISSTRASGPISRRNLALAALVAGLALSNYPPFGLLAPAALFYVYRFSKQNKELRFSQNLWMTALLAAGLLPYILLPIRANSDPLLNWGNPSTAQLFWKHISAAQYSIFLGSPKFSLLSNALSLWWDQWSAPIWLLLLPGIIFLWRFRSADFYFTLIIGMMNILYVLTYDITDVSSAPSDFYAYLLPLCWVSAIWIGAGTHWILLLIRRFIKWEIGWIATAALAAAMIPIFTAAKFWEDSNKRDYFYADDFVRSILTALPENALVLAPDWTFVSPALYLQHVEKIRTDVVVLDTELLRHSWYSRYVKKRAPWLAQSTESEINGFLNELLKFETNRKYDAELITRKYVEMINHFISNALALKHPPHILLNLEAKELNAQSYSNWERILKRPPFITTGVDPRVIGGQYQWVPENLAFRLYADNQFHPLPAIRIPPRELDPSRHYDPVTRGVIARYAEFWRWRGDYLRFHQHCGPAIESYQQALKIIPYLAEATEGLNFCVLELSSQ